MLRVSLLLSICAHLILLGVSSIFFFFNSPSEKNVERTFQVEFHKTVITSTELPQEQRDLSSIKNTDRQLPQSHALPALESVVVKKQLVKKFFTQTPTPRNSSQKQAPKIPPLPKFTPSIEDITMTALELQRPTLPPTPQPQPEKQPIQHQLPIEHVQPVIAAATTPAPISPPSPESRNDHQPSAPLDSTATPDNQIASLTTSEIQANVLDEYLQKIIKKIYAAQSYPPQARRKGWEGTIVVELHILSSGQVEKMAVIEQSKYALLNESALKTLQKIKTFPPFPQGFTSESITVTIPIQFQLKTH